MTDLDVALCQYALGTADAPEELFDVVAGLIASAADADLYVLPELFTVDVALADDGETPAGETAFDPTTSAAYHEALERLAGERDAVVVGGSYNARGGDEEGRGSDDHTAPEDPLYNRVPVATPDGVRTYDKCHPTPGERADGTVPGETAPPVFEHAGVGIGVLNCYDVEFPATVREVVDRGAEVLAVPSWTATDAGYERVRRCAAARAVEDQCYVAHVSLVGARGADGGTGRSAVFAPCDDVMGPHGTRLSLPRDEHAAATCTVDVAALRASRRRASVRPYTDAREVF